MDLDTFAEMQRRRIRETPVDRRRDVAGISERIDIAVIAKQLRLMDDFLSPQDPIRSAYRKNKLVYE